MLSPHILDRAARVVQITDWLPPEFSAVSQYALKAAAEEAAAGRAITVVGLNSIDLAPSPATAPGAGLKILRVRCARYDKKSWIRRLYWSLKSNMLLIKGAWPHMRESDVIQFTGSPPFLLYFVFAANLFLKKQLIYRITDFYPECIMAAMERPSLALRALQWLTNFLRRRVDRFEVLGKDMELRLLECGVDRDRISLRRDSSPVAVTPSARPLPRSDEFLGKMLVLYSGNWGVAHDVDTFFEGYKLHHQRGSAHAVLWLNATGSGADEMQTKLEHFGLPFYRQGLVPLKQLSHLLVTPDAHLITLRTKFLGYVLPSKVYGCLASGKPILYVGPSGSDVHELCSNQKNVAYRHVEAGDVAGVEAALNTLPWAISDQHPGSTLP